MMEFSFEMSRQNRLFTGPFAMMPFYRESHTFPEWMLADPRYHELWSQPYLAELAEVRRSYGQLVGLPLGPSETKNKATGTD